MWNWDKYIACYYLLHVIFWTDLSAASECVRAADARTLSWDQFYLGKANRGLYGTKCNGSVNNHVIYDYSRHNEFCRWSSKDFTTIANPYGAPMDAAWCFDANNDVFECEVLPCSGSGPGTDSEEAPFVGKVLLRQGKLQRIFYFHQLPETLNYYYTHIPEYLDCVVTRTVNTKLYKSNIGILSVYLRIKTSDSRKNLHGYILNGYLGCQKQQNYISPGLDQAVINKHMFWHCDSKDAYDKCALNSCGYGIAAQQHYFVNGRGPSGDHLSEERLRFSIKDYSREKDLNNLEEGQKSYEFFWGKLPYNDGMKHFSCEAVLSESYPDDVRSKALEYIAQSYSKAPVSIPMHSQLFGPELVGYREPSFGMLIYYYNEGPGEWMELSGRKHVHSPGSLIRFDFSVTAAYDTQWLQAGIRYNYRQKDQRIVGEEREIGCDTKGYAYHKNEPGWMETSRHASYHNKSSIYHTEGLPCETLIRCIKKGCRFSLYMRLQVENSGEIKGFTKPGNSDSSYNTGFRKEYKVLKEAEWFPWQQWAACGTYCTLSQKYRHRLRMCSVGVVGPLYEHYDEYKNMKLCTGIGGKQNLTLEYMNSTCWGSGDCLTNPAGIKNGMSAKVKYNGKEMNLLTSPPANLEDPITLFELHGNKPAVPAKDRLWENPDSWIKYTADAQKEMLEYDRVPGEKTALIGVKNGSDVIFEWKLDLDASGIPSDMRISNVSLSKSQGLAIDCWSKNIVPCQTDIFKYPSTECRFGLNGEPNKFVFKSFNTFVPSAEKYANFDYYLRKLKWTLTNDGRKAIVKADFTNIADESFGLYQPKAQLLNVSTNKAAAWVALRPMLDLRIDRPLKFEVTNPKDFTRPGLVDYALRKYKDEDYPLLINVKTSIEIGAGNTALSWFNLVRPPTNILKAQMHVGCKRPPETYGKVWISQQAIEETFTTHGIPAIDFRRYRLVVSYNVQQTGRELIDIINNYDVLHLQFGIEYRGKTYLQGIARRLKIKDNSTVPKTFRPWPQKTEISSFATMAIHKIHDVYFCADKPVDGGWSVSHSEHSKTCGLSMKTDFMRCDNPYPYKGGKDCQGSKAYAYEVQLPSCPLRGSWADWKSWSACAQTCGLCTGSRTRECTLRPGAIFCEGSAEADRAKGYESRTFLQNTACGGDCDSDHDCSGMGAFATCEGKPKQCRFGCKNSLHCANGICTKIYPHLSVCMDQCGDLYNDCSNSEICVARRCVKKCDSADYDDPLCSGPDEHCSKVNGYCTKTCPDRFSCRRDLGPLGVCYNVDQTSSERECVIGCRVTADCFNKNYKCVLGMCLKRDIQQDSGGKITCGNDLGCPETSVCESKACINPINSSRVCATYSGPCGASSECNNTVQGSGTCVSVANIGMTCTSDRDCGYVENCINGKCKLQQDFSGKVGYKRYNRCHNCNQAITSSMCVNDICKCPAALTMQGGVRCDDLSKKEGGTQTCKGDSCRLHCFSSTSCPFNHHCINRLCYSSCQTNGRSNYAKRELSCPGTNKWQCEDNLCKKSCTQDGNCFKNEKCLNKLCSNICERDQDCPVQWGCAGGVCTRSCSSLGHCANGRKCLAEACYAPCSSQSDCASNQKCAFGVCSSTCREDGDCRNKMLCFGGTCASECYDDTSCENGQACSEGACTPACTKNQECAQSGWSCNSGKCTMTCSSKSDCHASQECKNGICKKLIGSPCKRDKECNVNALYSYNKCVNDVCVVDFKPGANCVTSSQCGTFAICKYGKCEWPRDNEGNRYPSPTVIACDPIYNCSFGIAGLVCRENQLGDDVCVCKDGFQLLYAHCVPIGRGCRTTPDCPSDHLCQDGTCQTPCTADGSQCKNGLVCLSGGVCGYSCKSHDACPAGTTCQHGKCEKACSATDAMASKCAESNQQCIAGVCHAVVTDPHSCPDYTLLRGIECVAACKVDSGCPDICVVGGCSSSCSASKACPVGYHCLSSRCFAECQMEDGPDRCGLDPEHQCTVGLAQPAAGIGVCNFVSKTNVTTSLDKANVRSKIQCDVYTANPKSKNCGANSGTAGETDRGGGFIVGNTMAISCLHDNECEYPEQQMYCTAGYCSVICQAAKNPCDSDHTVCVAAAPQPTSVEACHIRCDKQTTYCPPLSYCGLREGKKVCLPLLNTECRTRLDCIDVHNTRKMHCNAFTNKCAFSDDIGEPCRRHMDCGTGSFCGSSGHCEEIPTGDIAYRPFIPEFPSGTTNHTIEDGKSGPCSHLGIRGLVYSFKRGRCECPSEYAIYGDRCIETYNDPGQNNLDVCIDENGCYDLMTCVANRCTWQCAEDCDEEYECVQAVCQPTCTRDSECTFGTRCYNGSCTVWCDKTPGKCGHNTKCIDGLCLEYPMIDKGACERRRLVPIRREKICLPECTSDNECRGTCVAGFCSSSCSALDPGCPAGRRCVSGQCYMDCSSDNQCPGSRQACISDICLKTCKLEDDCNGFTTCAGGHCVTRCVADIDCGVGLVCGEGLCTPPCSGEGDCSNGYKCGAGRCKLDCSVNASCSILQGCDKDTKQCKSNHGNDCETHDECYNTHLYYCHPVNKTCNYISMVDAPCFRQTCGLNEVCTLDGHCELRRDWNGRPTSHPATPVDTDYFSPKPPPNETCSTNSQCRESMDVCLSHRCYSPATKEKTFSGCVDGALPHRLVPSDGLMMNTCVGPIDCTSNQLCVNCMCAVKCTINIDCSTNQVCYEGICMENCGLGGFFKDCSTPADTCLDDICRDTCVEGIPTPYGICSAGIINAKCDAETSCPHGYLCERLKCERLCSENGDCANGQICALSICTTPCLNVKSSDCINGTQMNRCYSNLDCAESRVCTYGICTPPCSCDETSSCKTTDCAGDDWFCDKTVKGCVHNSHAYGAADEIGNIGKACNSKDSCEHYNLYCNLEKGICQPVTKPPSVVICTAQSDHSFCGVHGECVKGKCDCIRNGADVCVGSPPVPCTVSGGSDSCQHDQICDPTYGWCRCPIGSIFVGGSCIVVKAAPPGEAGGFFHLCSLDSQCPAGASCVSGNCYPHCSENCFLYPEMSCYSGLCSLSCLSNSDCDARQFCSPNGVCVQTCKDRAHEECARGQFCHNGQCEKSCESAFDCTADSQCVEHSCVSKCVADSECSEVCVQGLCGESCTRRSDCMSGKSCQNGKCLQSCKTSAMCPFSQLCIQGYCSIDCEPITDECRDACTTNTQCAAGLVCVEGTCSGKCSNQSDCGGKNRCRNGFCVIPCSGECPSHLYCDFDVGYCQTTTGTLCDSSSDCESQQFCLGQLCRNGVLRGSSCKAARECGREEICVNGACDCLKGHDGKCIAYPVSCSSSNSDVSGQSACATSILNSQCDSETNWCLCKELTHQRHGDQCVAPPSRLCENDRCPSGYECRGHKCYQRCDIANSDCSVGMTCVNGYCDYPCKQDSSCNEGQKCECGVCMNACTEDSQCFTLQSCHAGVCREKCVEHGATAASSCTTKTTESCHNDTDCADATFCHTSLCHKICPTDENLYQCSTSGFTCQQNLCRKICPTTVSCRVIPGEVHNRCGCPSPKIRYEDCLLYDVFCPPATYIPSGYTLVDISEAKTCNDLVSNAECSPDKSRCVCKTGLVQYAGAVCQVELQGCDEIANCSSGYTCHLGYCYKMCSADSTNCPANTKCGADSKLCMLKCSSSQNCLGYQVCDEEQGICVTTRRNVRDLGKAPDPACIGEGRDAKCPMPLVETCVDDFCECIEGMKRSEFTQQCEWSIDIVCLQCMPCLEEGAPCADLNMKCASASRICMCVDGYKLDDSGKRCVPDERAVSEIDCEDASDCGLLPNSRCNVRQGKCQCISNHCYSGKYCQADTNECNNATCTDDNVCVDLSCAKPPGTCVPFDYTTTLSTTNLLCSTAEDCKGSIGELSYCFAQRCTCVVGSALLIQGMCVRVDFCTRDIDCDLGHRCHFGICLEGGPAVRAARKDDGSGIVSYKVDIGGIIIACAMAIAIMAMIVVTVHLHREYKKKNAAEFDNKEIASRVEWRKSSIAVKKEGLASKMQTTKDESDIELPAELNEEVVDSKEVKLELKPDELVKSPSIKSTRGKANKNKSGSSVAASVAASATSGVPNEAFEDANNVPSAWTAAMTDKKNTKK